MIAPPTDNIATPAAGKPRRRSKAVLVAQPNKPARGQARNPARWRSIQMSEVTNRTAAHASVATAVTDRNSGINSAGVCG
jgi:hypothetical protein